MRVAIVSGICVPHDAISNAVLQEREVLRSAGHDVAIYCQGTTMLDDPDIHPGADPWLMTRHVGYRTADLAIFHFGTGYELFDALLLAAPGMLRVVRFHNVTPPSLLTGVHRRRAQQGLDQVVICESADHIWCDSEFNRLTLAELGVPLPKSSVLELCVPEISALLQETLPDTADPLTIAFVGRIVEAKGVPDLHEAFRRSELVADGVGLVVAGNTSQSSPELVGAMRKSVNDHPEQGMILVEDPSAEQLDGVYRSASVFAMPSYHEGFCVPVVEALARGLHVVASDAGALGEVVGERGRVVTPGDLDALAAALRAAVDDVRSHGRVEVDRQWLGQFSFESFEERFLSALRALGLPA